MKLTSWILATTALLLALVTLTRMPEMFADPAAVPPSPVQVTIDNFAYAPATVTIPLGTSVRWVNRDDIPHNVVSKDKSFKSKVLDTHEEFTYTFSQPGTYSYFCSIHSWMAGKVIVH